MSVEIKLNKKEFERDIAMLRIRYKSAADDEMRNQMRMLTNGIVKVFPPADLRRTRTESPKKIGERRVLKDLEKIFVPVNADIPRWMEEGGQFFAFKTKTGAVYGVEADWYMKNPSHTTLRNVQNRYRGKNGRITTGRGGSEVGRNTEDIGRWKFVDKVHMPTNQFKAFVRKRQESVGKLRAGWIPALIAFRGKKAPNWVTRHPALGRVGTRTDKWGNVVYTATNNAVRYNSRSLQSITDFYVRNRKSFMLKSLRKRFEAEMNKFSRTA